jgi:YrbI family 3-deoxy-D-manno-octulosonate 8-phosphate phosphatase
VLTDGGMYYSDTGDEMKKFNTKDGMGMLELKKTHIKTAILSSGFKKNIGENRAKTLQVDKFYIGRESKLKILKIWLKELKISFKNVAYIGDDINDLEIINKVGFSACPMDAVEIIKQYVDVILFKKGGDGCVREFIDNYLITASEK